MLAGELHRRFPGLSGLGAQCAGMLHGTGNPVFWLVPVFTGYYVLPECSRVISSGE
jgi:hypothetical protein